MTAPSKPVLLTGASGNLGRHLAKTLGERGWTLRLTDITPFPDPLPPGASFVKADINDGVALLRQAVPEQRQRVYDMRHLLRALADSESVLELRAGFGRGMITALMRIPWS